MVGIRYFLIKRLIDHLRVVVQTFTAIEIKIHGFELTLHLVYNFIEIYQL